MKNKKVSIIVPVYNVDNYLEECLDSLVNQTYKNLEIILINDGSSDNSLEICKRYNKKDNRIKIIDFEKNFGYPHAINEGIKSSSGDYIVFIDSDDYITDNFIESLMKNTKKYVLTFCNDTLPEGEYSISDFANRFINGEILCRCTEYLFDKELLNNLFDEKIIYMVDSVFVLSELFNYKKVKIIHDGKYYYRENMNSLTKKKIDIIYLTDCYFNSIDKLMELMKKHKIEFDVKKVNHKKLRILFVDLYRLTYYKDLAKNLKLAKKYKFNELNIIDKVKYYVFKNNILNLYFYIRLFMRKIIKKY